MKEKMAIDNSKKNEYSKFMNNNIEKTKNFTIKELQATLNNDEFDYLMVSALVKFLVVLGAIKEVGKQKNETGRGKPATIYEIPQVVELQFFLDETEKKENLESNKDSVEVVREHLEDVAVQEVTPTSATPEDLNVELPKVVSPETSGNKVSS